MTGLSLRRDLLAEAAACDAEIRRYPTSSSDHERARTMLRAAAAACRSATEVFDRDPTLADEPSNTGRLRPVDLLAELARQLRGTLRGTVFAKARDDQPAPADRWEEAECIAHRIAHWATQIAVLVPRDTSTAAGVQQVSRARLAARHRDIAQAAQTLRQALADALRLTPPDPTAVALADLASSLEVTAQTLDSEHDAATRPVSNSLWGDRSAAP